MWALKPLDELLPSSQHHKYTGRPSDLGLEPQIRNEHTVKLEAPGQTIT